MPSFRTRFFYEQGRIEGLRSEIEAKADALAVSAALGRKANATTVGGIATALDAKASASDLEALAERVSNIEGKA